VSTDPFPHFPIVTGQVRPAEPISPVLENRMNDPPESDPGRLSQPERDWHRLAELVGLLVALRLPNRRKSQPVEDLASSKDIFIPRTGPGNRNPADEGSSLR
jgi:hypothetical protein